MRAMILAAGRGERMRPLTDDCPKPLLQAGGKPLIAWHLERLARAGIGEAVVNLSHLGERIVEGIGNGERFGMRISYSVEPERLETAGGIANALKLLGAEPFLLDSITVADFTLDDALRLLNPAAIALAVAGLAGLALILWHRARR